VGNQNSLEDDTEV